MKPTYAALFLLPLTACSAFFEDSTEVQADLAGDSFYSISTTTLEGEPAPLKQFNGQVALVVNTASKCGMTPQYAGLEDLYGKYKDQGFVVLGFPSADFGGQEFGSAAEIREFCTETYDVSFPLFETSKVKESEEQSPVFDFLSGVTGSVPGWNFGKYLVDREGNVLGFYDSRTTPDELASIIEAAL